MDSIDNSTSALLKALLVSSVVYLAPINYYDFGSHVWGSVLLSPNLNDTFGVAVWVSYIALTIVLQALLVISLYSLFRRITWRFFTPIVVIVLSVIIGLPLNVGAVWLDARFVPSIYRQAEGRTIDWEESCRIEHAHLLRPSDPRFAFLEQSSRAWVAAHPTREPKLLVRGRLPDGFLHNR
jgi:hypothetical protein